MTEMQERLDELNESTYELFASLDRNTTFLSEKQYALMANALYEQYKKAYDLLNLENSIEYRTSMYQFRQIVKLQVPHTFLGVKNKIAKVITAEIKEEFIMQFKARYAELISEQAKAERKQRTREAREVKKEAVRAKKEMKATKRRLKKDAKKAKKKSSKKDGQSE